MTVREGKGMIFIPLQISRHLFETFHLKLLPCIFLQISAPDIFSKMFLYHTYIFLFRLYLYLSVFKHKELEFFYQQKNPFNFTSIGNLKVIFKTKLKLNHDGMKKSHLKTKLSCDLV